jgi:N-methylhydantoinase B/oxoprolinase/acetone carboxylase alpha subunit
VSKRGRQPATTNQDMIREDADELRVLIRQAHEATKDVRAAMRDMESLKADLQVIQDALLEAAAYAISNGIEQIMNTAVEDGLASYNNAIKEAIKEAEDAIYERFDVIAGILMGDKDVDGSRPVIEDQARLVRKVTQGASPADLTAEEVERMTTIALRAKAVRQQHLEGGKR